MTCRYLAYIGGEFDTIHRLEVRRKQQSRVMALIMQVVAFISSWVDVLVDVQCCQLESSEYSCLLSTAVMYSDSNCNRYRLAEASFA